MLGNRLYKVAEGLNIEVELEGDQYHVKDLAKFIADFQGAKLVRDEKGLRLEAAEGHEEEYDNFKQDYLVQNEEQIRDLFLEYEEEYNALQ